MAEGAGNQRAPGKDAPADKTESDPGGRASGLPDLVRRALAMGFSGFFFTEETIRKALGDTLPKDWTDFAIDQSERTRKEFLERLSFELARTLETADLGKILRELLEGRTLEVRAEVRLRGSDEPGGGQPELRVARARMESQER